MSQTRDTEAFTHKLQMGKQAQVTEELIIARIESFVGDTLDDAITRAKAYVAAGADGVMIHSKDKSGEDIKSFVQRLGLLTLQHQSL